MGRAVDGTTTETGGAPVSVATVTSFIAGDPVNPATNRLAGSSQRVRGLAYC